MRSDGESAGLTRSEVMLHGTGSEVLFLGGRSGVGKSTAAEALHDLLAARNVAHALIEGDALDLAHPAPHVEHPDARLAERNLATMWGRYRELGYRRLIYTNTASVVSIPELVAAMGDEPRVTAVLLRASDRSTGDRLARRRGGEDATADLAHSAATAGRLDAAVDPSVHRIDTDDLRPGEIAERLLTLTGW